MGNDLEFQDNLSDYIRRIELAEKNLDPNCPIVTSDDLAIAPECTDNIEREQIAWRLYQHPMFYIVTVKEGTEVEPHSHSEDVFRYVIKGSLDIYVEAPGKDGPSEIHKTVNAGEWVVVRANRSYRIEAGTCKDENQDKEKHGHKRVGYVALVAYQMACKPK
jgi:hypothetical protein